MTSAICGSTRRARRGRRGPDDQPDRLSSARNSFAKHVQVVQGAMPGLDHGNCAPSLSLRCLTSRTTRRAGKKVGEVQRESGTASNSSGLVCPQSGTGPPRMAVDPASRRGSAQVRPIIAVTMSDAHRAQGVSVSRRARAVIRHRSRNRGSVSHPRTAAAVASGSPGGTAIPGALPST